MYKYSAPFRFNGYYLLVGALFAGMLYISNRYFKGSQYAAVGLAETKSYKINTDKAVNVLTIWVNEGQTVKQGDTLMLLSNPSLEVEISKTTKRIEQLKQEQTTEDKVTAAELAYIEASEGIVLEELQSDLQKLEAELKLNEAINKELNGKNSPAQTADNPKMVEVNSLQKQLQKQKEAINLKKLDVKQKHEVAKTQFYNQIELLTKEQQLLIAQQNRLIKIANSSGVVQSVYVKIGEQVEAYSPLLSVNPIQPTTVIAYANERNRENFLVGQTVSVTAQRNKSFTTTGKVIGFGSVTELPSILQKSTAVKAYGQEIFIEIPADNNFANGEKVIIR
jgi:multidrug resistance efflux pump